LRIHREAVSASQLHVIRRLHPLLARRPFYLGGGTALAIQLGHRRSVDLDWFCEEPISDPLRLAAEVQESVPFAGGRTESGTLHGAISGVRVSFIEYRYPLLRPLLLLGELGAQAASLEDLACMKLAAIAQRGAKKDFLDLYALGRQFSLQEMLALYAEKYRTRDWGHLLFALAFFDDADHERTPRLLKSPPWPEVKAAIRRWVGQMSR
jgi:hypothetical protein